MEFALLIFLGIVWFGLGEQLAHNPLHQHLCELVRGFGAGGWVLGHRTASQRGAFSVRVRTLRKS